MSTENSTQTIGERLKSLRKSKGFILKDVEAKTKITAATLSNLENNLFKPSLAVLVKLSSLYDESIDYIVNGKLYAGNRIAFELYPNNSMDDTMQSSENEKFSPLSSDISTRDDILTYYEKSLQLEKQFSEILKRENNILKNLLGGLLKTHKENGSIVLDEITFVKYASMLR